MLPESRESGLWFTFRDRDQLADMTRRPDKALCCVRVRRRCAERHAGGVTDFSIRESHSGDGVVCAGLWREIGGLFAALEPRIFQAPAEEGLAEWFEEINAVYRNDTDKLLLIAEVDGVLAGTVAASLHEPLETADRQVQTDLARRRLHVDSLAVTGTHRRGGIGSALMRAVEEWGRSQGAQVIVLETETNNPMSVPFYEQRMGFTAQAVVFRKEIDSHAVLSRCRTPSGGRPA